MPVRKPTKTTSSSEKEAGADAFIEKGGSSPVPEPKEDETVPTRIYIKRSLLDQVDAARQPPNHPFVLNRNQWIMTAILEKLEREG